MLIFMVCGPIYKPRALIFVRARPAWMILTWVNCTIMAIMELSAAGSGAA